MLQWKGKDNMEIKKLVEQYSKDILDESNQDAQNAAMISVVTILSNEMGQKLADANVINLKRKEKKKELARVLQETNNEYAEFVSEINKLAGKELLKPDGIKKMLAKSVKI